MFIKYYESGYSVIPVETKTAAPIEREWTRWATERQVATKIEEYESTYYTPKHGIGLVCGPISGVVALDIDSESEDILKLCPPSPVRKRGSKGETRFFKYSPSLRTVRSKRDNIGPNKQQEDQEGIELLCAGTQTVIPPSLNRKTMKPYTWTTPDTLLDIKPSDLPEITQAELDRVIHYIEQFKGAEGGMGRNNQLAKVAWAMLHEHFDEPDLVLADKLLSYDIRQHSRPYFSDMTEPEAKRAKGNPIDAAKIFIARCRQQFTSKGEVVVTERKEDRLAGLGIEMRKNGPVCNQLAVSRCLSGLEELRTGIWYDSFYSLIMTNWGTSERPWSDADSVRLQIFLQEIGLTNIGPRMINDGVLLHATQSERNCVQDWLRSLPAWDGLDRVGCLFAAYFGAEANEYTTKVSENFLVSMVSRVMAPGSKVDNMVILEGIQGILKSSALLALVGEQWFTELNADMDSKDAVLAMQGKWIIEIAELDKMIKTSPETVKRILSTKNDRIRIPFGKFTSTFPRQSVFVGTTNEHEDYLKDPTGGRRFWPIRCSKIELEHLKKDRAQLFAQALLMYKAGYKYWEVPLGLAYDEVSSRTESDPWEEPVRHFLETRLCSEPITIVTILVDCLGMKIGDTNPRLASRASIVLRKIGYVRKRNSAFRYYEKGPRVVAVSEP